MSSLDVSAYDTIRAAMSAAGLRRPFDVWSGGAAHTVYFDGRGRLAVKLSNGFWSYPEVAPTAPIYEAIDAARAIYRGSKTAGAR